MANLESAVKSNPSDTLQRLERIFAEKYILPYLKSPSEDILKQTLVILEQQFEKDYCGEVGGSIFYRPEGLEFQIVKSKSSILLEERLTRFEQGEPTDFSELAAVAKERVDISNKFEPDSVSMSIVTAIYGIFKGLVQEPHTASLFTKEAKKGISNLYRKLIIDTQYNFTFSELKAPGKMFLGVFHVHNDGSEPSLGDLIENQKMHFPDLVISAEKDYLASGIKLHLIYSGVSHLLYNGPVETKPTK